MRPEVLEAQELVINGMACSEDEAMVAYGFALDAGYQGTFEEFKEWRMSTNSLSKPKTQNGLGN